MTHTLFWKSSRDQQDVKPKFSYLCKCADQSSAQDRAADAVDYVNSGKSEVTTEDLQA